MMIDINQIMNMLKGIKALKNIGYINLKSMLFSLK